MRLLSLSLENWRGIDSRQIQLSPGVTLIEGPNEIGKSTIVEAIRMLFRELDSAKKREVKAIQPVGQDVGSSVQAEVMAGEYHFIYAKTYNRAPKTSLDILAPKKRQLTGREAHEEVERILGETVDLVLWDALLVEQGEKVALADFQDSTGLAEALDEAAGSSAGGGEDSALYKVVQSEYEKYFTLKTGKPKYSSLEITYQKSRTSLEEARQALVSVDEDSQAHVRSAAEVRRLRSGLPGLESKVKEYEKNWRGIKSLNEKVDTRSKELDSVRILQQSAIDAQKDRQDQAEDIRLNKESLKTIESSIEPLRTRAEALSEKMKSTQSDIAEVRQQVKIVKATLRLAQTDESQLRSLAALATGKERLKQLKKISQKMKTELATAGLIKIDSVIINDFRNAERQLDIAGSKRDSAATVMTLTAEAKLDLEINNDTIPLNVSETETRTVSSGMTIRIPDIASIHLTPPSSVSELEYEAEDAKAAFEELKLRFGVNNLKEAEALNEQGKAARMEVERLKEQEQAILKGTNREEIEQSVKSMQTDYDNYIKQRDSSHKLPGSVAEAFARISLAKTELENREKLLDATRLKSEGLQAEYVKVDNQLRIAQQDHAAFEAALGEKRNRLEKTRSAETDDDLAKRVRRTGDRFKQLERETNALKTDLQESSPDTIEALLGNSQDVYTRANSDMNAELRNLAVLTDRLQRAQADGRFEKMEMAEREFEECGFRYRSTHRRAMAAELLWSTLNKHRDAARQAYVKPLKEAIERLGSIVFGSGFEVELADDWSLLSRTLQDKTLPFDDLSVGAKEQLGILTRLAAGQIVSKQGGVPLIIDDALGFSDPGRLETMGAAIAAAGKQCQIIILTCTPGRFTHVGSAELVRF